MTERDAYEFAVRHGVKIRKRGDAWVLSGPGVSVLCSDLRALQPRDFFPVRRNDEQRARQQCDAMTRDFQRVNDDR